MSGYSYAEVMSIHAEGAKQPRKPWQHDEAGQGLGQELDLSRPSPARLYDCFLGGTDNYAVDQAAAARIRAVFPGLSDAAWANRGFHGRAAAWMARRGVRQFIDVGPGLPTMDNTHQVIQRIDPNSRVVYADNDTQVVLHSEALLAGRGNAAVIQADLRDPAGLLGHPMLAARIDFGRPCGLLITAVAHFVADEHDPWKQVAFLIFALAPGSYLALSHATADGIPPAAVRAGQYVYENATERIYLRTRAEVDRFFDGLDLVPPYPGAEPTLAYVGTWGCENPRAADSDGSRALYCAVARRP